MRKSQGTFTFQCSSIACLEWIALELKWGCLIHLFTSITFSFMSQTDRWLTLRSLVWPIFCGERHGKMTGNADWPLWNKWGSSLCTLKIKWYGLTYSNGFLCVYRIKLFLICILYSYITGPSETVGFHFEHPEWHFEWEVWLHRLFLTQWGVIRIHSIEGIFSTSLFMKCYEHLTES